jgi:alkanesulfonate monooxygenase SsuD/methylene tetrahydromethanopterin reductase-like flavin-dependent oxidoreductase (luciferase family)
MVEHSQFCHPSRYPPAAERNRHAGWRRLFPADYGIDTAELAQALETRGFASLYLPEHTHIPVSDNYAPLAAAE